MRILVAEDDSITRRLLQAHLLKWGHELSVCVTGDEAWDILSREGAPRLAVLDWMMPGKDGVTICRELRRLTNRAYTYIILLTARTRKEDVIEGLEAGADDYIVKPFDAHELQVRIRAGVRIIGLQEELEASLANLEYQAAHDNLTGLWNRKAILDILAREMERADRENSILGVAISDLDHFKRINDSYGHLAGDAVLREVAARIGAAMRPYDSAGRYGGEEFLLVCPGCKLDDVRSLAERLRQVVHDTTVKTSEGLIKVTMSFGVSCYSGGRDGDANRVIRSADQALFKAKDRGRNRVETSPEIDETPRIKPFS
jgi:diguanylate cyclase (GGDEF)-like protein